jgi:hypothetical protein
VGTDKILPALLQQGAVLRTTPVLHIQSLHGIWIYPNGLETSMSDVYYKDQEILLHRG